MQQERDQPDPESEFVVIQPLTDARDQELFLQRICLLVENYRNFQSGKYFSIYFSKLHCFTLDYLYQGIQSKYYEIDQLTLLKISADILNHYQTLMLGGISHGQLIMKNIIIEQSKDLKLKRGSQTLQVEKVYFIRYQFPQNNETSQDYQSILSIIKQLIPQSFCEFDQSIDFASIVWKIKEQINGITKKENKIVNYVRSWIGVGIKPVTTYYSKECDEALSLIPIKFEQELGKSKFYESTMQIQQKMITNIVQYLKQKFIEKAKIKRIQEIGQWLCSSILTISWKLSESDQLIQDGVCKIDKFLQKLKLQDLKKQFEDQLKEIEQVYLQIFKFETKLNQDIFFEHYFCEIVSKIDDENLLEINFFNLFSEIMQKDYQEMLKIEILKLINELI